MVQSNALYGSREVRVRNGLVLLLISHDLNFLLIDRWLFYCHLTVAGAGLQRFSPES
jgi:hypothetical protein